MIRVSKRLTGGSRAKVSEPQFYANKAVQEYAQFKPTPITLRQLLFYERHRTNERLLKSANYVRQELPIRIAHRLRDMQQLPFIVGMNSHILTVYQLYLDAFERLRCCKPIETLGDNARFCQTLQHSLQDHLVVIPHLALGMQECQEYITIEKRDNFMNTLLRSRISRRVLAEQHLVLSGCPPVVTSAANDDLPESGKTMVFQHCKAQQILRNCISRLEPKYPGIKMIIQQSCDVEFSYVLDHIEYILYQILRNSLCHTKSRHPSHLHACPPIYITVCANDTDVYFRISDKAGGIPASVYPQLWSFGRHGNFKNVKTWTGTINEQIANENDPAAAQLMPLGMGLPMSKVYAEFWGGDISIMTLDNFGTDAYVRIPKLGDQLEHLDEEFSASDLHSQVDSGSLAEHRKYFVIK
ncbi:alpha-ketoacid dehydrogenase kinase [Hesseltinella vesiculosa]|uniref:Protein-serine/threonine kinase n=1 Tax=Hesseltinella vesiculosa TaxID=101127 RepID=A0A1X2G6J7_9FUNG|nr:alpha-ketoacid dehydrogenase kinase [Hesseltinella vesiculosa]